MTVIERDYGLAGDETEQALESGLANAEWYRSPIDADLLRRLSQRSDGRAARDIVLWSGLLVGSGLLAFFTIGSWVSVPAFVVYWALYGGSADARWHECGHGTAFRTDWLNTLFYYPASFMLFRGPTHWKWSHVRHHSDTIIVGRDPEIIFPRPTSTVLWVIDLLHVLSGPKMLAQMGRHALGRIEPGVASFLPPDARPKVIREARISLAILIGTVIWSVATLSIVPLLFIGGPTFLGSWMLKFFGSTQHAGLQEDVLDHRYNSRTVLMNPAFRFLYLNMNYHIEHHMFPTVPYRNLPKLHEAIRDDLPEPHPGNWSAYRELLSAIKAQRRDSTYEIPDRVPATTIETAENVDQSVRGADPTADSGNGGWVVEVDSDGWVAVPVGSRPPETIVRIDVGDATFAAYRLAEAWHVTEGICTHSRRVHLVGGVIVDGQIECPKHNGRFDIVTGEPTRAPACEALAGHLTEQTADGFRFRL